MQERKEEDDGCELIFVKQRAKEKGSGIIGERVAPTQAESRIGGGDSGGDSSPAGPARAQRRKRETKSTALASCLMLVMAVIHRTALVSSCLNQKQPLEGGEQAGLDLHGDPPSLPASPSPLAGPGGVQRLAAKRKLRARSCTALGSKGLTWVHVLITLYAPLCSQRPRDYYILF